MRGRSRTWSKAESFADYRKRIDLENLDAARRILSTAKYEKSPLMIKIAKATLQRLGHPNTE